MTVEQAELALLSRPVAFPVMEGCDAIGRIAGRYAETLREALRRRFPARAFEVEVIGADDVAEEPLEVCVTFSRGG